MPLGPRRARWSPRGAPARHVSLAEGLARRGSPPAWGLPTTSSRSESAPKKCLGSRRSHCPVSVDRKAAPQRVAAAWRVGHTAGGGATPPPPSPRSGRCPSRMSPPVGRKSGYEAGTCPRTCA
ncbi:hypothetical protein GQ55_2G412000 [Panicum hallii var. hallii]|uniref:Uncharacterized protein n=1 Tax=Panicum hallii var. hallii TaxID=1504633 RepID=A0A2T7EXV5_9POAL|nr:hypothetical protein GQ55_2G412000 [Panicum hallii var. hallii]